MKGCGLDLATTEGVRNPSQWLGWSVRSRQNLTEWVVYCGVLEVESSGRKHGPPTPWRPIPSDPPPPTVPPQTTLSAGDISHPNHNTWHYRLNGMPLNSYVETPTANVMSLKIGNLKKSN